MMQQLAKFNVGQLIRHNKYGYRGVIVDVDPIFSGTEEWYSSVATSKPPKEKPWYHVLVHDDDAETYVAEQHLQTDWLPEPVEHPYVDVFFSDFEQDHYVLRQAIN